MAKAKSLKTDKRGNDSKSCSRENAEVHSNRAESRNPNSLFVVRSWDTDSNASFRTMSFGINSTFSETEQEAGCDPFRGFPGLSFGQEVNENK